MLKRDAGRPRSTRTPQFEEDVLRLLEENPSISTRKVAQTLHTSQNAVWQVGGVLPTSTVCGVVFTTMHTAATILELGAIHR